MTNAPPSKSHAADLNLSAHQELKQIKIEITVKILPPENMSTVPEPNASPQLDITKTEELLPPVLSPLDIQKFLGIGKKQSYELLNSNLFYVCHV
ncbi:hypothetical protein BSK54_10415 [Paenibacillus odorifer]|uniref:hypothetical protein n=1 Tax=Paenibacillus odorifer TaxID=189426 RepID=UPI00096D4117|nr:hypothetical protein [Paenibacillus odorifer]OME02660.1 hypothetical protein BSK54_10415 [Paenibacillus odorifer]